MKSLFESIFMPEKVRSLTRTPRARLDLTQRQFLGFFAENEGCGKEGKKSELI